MDQTRAPARGQRLVAMSYQADDEYLAINHQVLGEEAEVVFLQRRPPQEWPDIVGRAETLLAFNPQRELPPGLLALARELRFIQLLMAGADRLDFARTPERIVVAGNTSANDGAVGGGPRRPGPRVAGRRLPPDTVQRDGAFGQRAGRVEAQGIDPAQRLDGAGVADERVAPTTAVRC